jgi:hypothetical protein
VDHIAGLLGCKFSPHERKTVSFHPRNLPNYMANTPYHVYRCSQRSQSWGLSDSVPTKKRRNRVAMERRDCQGMFKVFFCDPILLPPNMMDAKIAIEYTHVVHPCRQAYGVPVVLRDWIKNNSQGRTSYEVWDMLMSAVEGGDFHDLDKDYISQANVLYWYRKGQLERNVHLTDDPWLNLEAMLKENPQVSIICCYSKCRRPSCSTKSPEST